MDASFIRAALLAAHPDAAFVEELTIRAQGQRYKDAPWDHVERERRIDMLMFESLQRTAIEVKVSKADAARETFDKTEPWWRVSHRFIYAVPAHLIDVPPRYGAGLWWVHEDGRVEVKQRASVNKYPEPLPQLTVQAIAYRASMALRSGVQDAHRSNVRELKSLRDRNMSLDRQVQRLGMRVLELEEQLSQRTSMS